MAHSLSQDPLLSRVADLFVVPPKPSDLVEPPSRPASARGYRRLRRTVYTPEFLAVAAVIILSTCTLLGGLLNNGVIALCGLAAPILLGVGCYFAIRNHRTGRPAGSGMNQSRAG